MPGKNHESKKLLEERDRQIEKRICACLGLPRTNASGEARHSGRDAIPIESLSALAEAAKTYLRELPGAEISPYGEVIEETMKTILPGDEERAAARITPDASGYRPPIAVVKVLARAVARNVKMLRRTHSPPVNDLKNHRLGVNAPLEAG